MSNLPDGSQYNYISSTYEFSLFNSQGVLDEKAVIEATSEENIVLKVNQLVDKIKEPLFIIIEAAAGFGKTCSAYEILNLYSINTRKYLPFFTELSRNREARIFKHILHNEIDQQFQTGIKSDVVINQIRKGRIPLIIDGFDELLTKDLTYNKKDFKQVESMLSTIMNLLQGKAKIIITSRKTAIFNSEEFFNWAISSNNDFYFARFEIREPTIENWLSKDRLEIIEKSNFPIRQIANPVLLAYLRNIGLENLKSFFNQNSNKSIVEYYIDYLLSREQTRQNLKMNNTVQLTIFRKLVRIMTEFDIKSETKDTIKDFIKEYNPNKIKESLKNYTPDERPTFDDMVETLSNHVFLDRKENGMVGFVNDFILGLLIGENLILKKYQQYYDNFCWIIPQSFAILAFSAFKVQSQEKKDKIWEIFNKNDFNYDQNFFFCLDIEYKKRINRNYELFFIEGYYIEGVSFSGNFIIRESSFSNISFHSCHFDFNLFHKCSFINCAFYNCAYENLAPDTYKNNFILFGCKDDNNLTRDLLNTSINEENNDTILGEKEILEQFLNVDHSKPKVKPLSQIKSDFSEFDLKDINKIINKLKSEGKIEIDGDMGFLTRDGHKYYFKNYRH